MARYGAKASQKVEKAMHEYKRGELKSSSGQKVKSRKQAIAIGLSEAREAGGKVPSRANGRKRSTKTSSAPKRIASTRSRTGARKRTTSSSRSRSGTTTRRASGSRTRRPTARSRSTTSSARKRTSGSRSSSRSSSRASGSRRRS